jgi:hypothetical protein
MVNPLKASLNFICRLLAILGAHHILHVSRIRVKETCANSHFVLICSSNISRINNLRIELTDELTSWKGVLDELVVPHLVKKFSALYEPQISLPASFPYSESN